MDFGSDALFDGWHLRALTAANSYTREALVIDVDYGIKDEQAVQAMARIASMLGSPKSIWVDNGPESSRRRSTAELTRRRISAMFGASRALQVPRRISKRGL